MQKVGVVILAAGDGKRMKTGIPKVMNLLHGEPMVSHVVKSVEKSGLVEKPVVIICTNHTLVQDYLKDRAIYAVQEKQLGTAHAVGCAEELLKDKVASVVVLNGDMPFISSESLKHLAEVHQKNQNKITLMTVSVPDFDGWRAQFADFGRIKRDNNNNVIGIVEKKDATPEELTITELNTSYFCFDAEWLWTNIKTIKNQNAQNEYYLVDLVKIASEQGAKMGAVPIDPKEAVGINTKEHLEIAQTI